MITRRHYLSISAATAALLASAGCAGAGARDARASSFSTPLRDGMLEVTGLGDRAFRVRFSTGAVAPNPYTEILLPGIATSTPRRAYVDGRVRLSLPHAACEIDPASGRVSFFDGAGNLLLEEAEGGRALTEMMLGDERAYVAEQAFVSAPDEHIYGLGCFQDGRVDLRGWPRRLTQVNSQISLPFVLSSKGYGLLWHNTGMSEFNPLPDSVRLTKISASAEAERANATTTTGNAEVARRDAVFEASFNVAKSGKHAFLLDIGAKMASRIRVEIDGVAQVDLTNIWLPPTASFHTELATGAHVVRVLARDDDAPTLHFGPVEDRTTWRSPVAAAVDYVVIAGPRADEVMDAYHELTGRAPILPRWAYGYTHCRERFRSSEEILENAREFRRRNLPIDIIVQDWQYWGRHGWNAMRFDERFYPDPAALVREVHALRMRLMLSVWSKVPPDSEFGREFASRGYLIDGTEWIDFYNPRAAAFYAQQQTERLASLGIDAWWQDATEPENDDLVGRQTAAGAGEWVRLNYPLQVARTVYDAQRAYRPDQRALILTRSAFPGQQRYTALTWSGDIGNDWDTLKRQIAAGIGMAAAGYPYWTVDAGGFFRPGEGQYTDEAYHERFLRWFQYATFLPSQRVHGYQTNTEFWRYGARVESLSRDYLNLRYRLLPYIYTMGAETWRTGAPLIRPLVFDFAQDAAALDQTHAFMFGRALLVHPVFEPEVMIWPCYLPQSPGGWFDFWSDEKREGGRTYEVDAPPAQIPVHVRAGSILPLGPVVQSSGEATGHDIELHIYPGADGAYDLYEDGGLDYEYEQGVSSLIGMRWRDRERQLEIGARRGAFPGMLEARTFIAVRHDGAGGAERQEIPYDGRAVSVRFS